MDKTKAQLTSLIPMSDNSPAIDAGQLIQRPPFDCFMDSAEMDEIRSSKLPTYDELPNVPLYRDQVISYSRSGYLVYHFDTKAARSMLEFRVADPFNDQQLR